jgi:hypothetical protein
MLVVRITETLTDPDLFNFINKKAYLYLLYIFSVSNCCHNDSNIVEVVLTHLLVSIHDSQLIMEITFLHIDQF